MFEDDKTIDINIDDLFKDDTAEDDEVEETVDTTNESTSDITTKAVSERINSVKKKTEAETRDNVAKELGYESYAAMQKANEQKMFKDAGLDEAEASKLVEELLEKRLANDPRMKKLEEFEAKERNNYVDSQLKKVNAIAGTSFTSIDEVPADVLKVWEKTGDLKQAYLAVKGEELILKNQSNLSRGSTTHLANPSNGGVSSNTRPLTEEEKAIYRSVMPDITEEELNKKTMMID